MPPVRRLLAIAVLAASAVLLPVACAPQPSELAWVECSWVALESSPDPRGTYDRAALLVPVLMGGAEVYLQLDTGRCSSQLNKGVADLTGLSYEIVREMPEVPPEQGRAWHATVRGFRFGDLQLDLTHWLLVEEPEDQARAEVISRMKADVPMIAGSLGADAFQQGCLVLDLREGRAAFAGRAPGLRGESVPLTLVGGCPVFSLGGGVSLRVLFDTGTSAFGLVCRPDLFVSLAGREAGWTLPVTVVGGVGEMRGARVELDVIVGTEVLRLTEVYTIELIDQLYSATGGAVEAVAGNELFRDRVVAVDFANRKLIVGPADSGADRR